MLFYLLFVFLVFGRYCLDAAIYGNLQDLEEQDFEQQQAEKQDKCFLTMLNLYSFSLSYTFVCFNLITYTFIPLGFGFYGWLVLFSPAIF
jgi:hypothetical protein